MIIKEVWPISIFFSRWNVIIKMCIMFNSFFFSQTVVGDIMIDTSGRFRSLFAEYSLSHGRSQCKFVTFGHLKLRPSKFFPCTDVWGYAGTLIWDSSKFCSIKPKSDIGLFVDLAEFTCFYQFRCDHKIVL